MTYRSHGLKRLHHIRIYERLKSQRQDMKKKRQAFDHCVRNLQVIQVILYSVNCFYWFRVYWVFVYCFYCMLLVLLEILSLAWALNIPTNCFVTMCGLYLILPLNVLLFCCCFFKSLLQSYCATGFRMNFIWFHPWAWSFLISFVIKVHTHPQPCLYMMYRRRHSMSESSV